MEAGAISPLREGCVRIVERVHSCGLSLHIFGTTKLFSSRSAIAVTFSKTELQPMNQSAMVVAVNYGVKATTTNFGTMISFGMLGPEGMEGHSSIWR